MNRNAWIDRQTRLGCAAAAALSCAVVIGSVLRLFGDAPAQTTAAATAAPQVLVSAEERVGRERTRVR